MDESKTDERGYFVLSGTAYEITPIDPILIIYHSCNNAPEQVYFFPINLQKLDWVKPRTISSSPKNPHF